MVLDKRPRNNGINYIAGILIIGLSIYFFYISLAFKNSPELFLTPEPVAAEDFPFSQITLETFSVQIPLSFEYTPADAGLELFSAKDRVRASIKLMDTLPEEEQWRQSLSTPIMGFFIGDARGQETYHLMRRILDQRYNPSLMGAKSRLIPAWMKNGPDARILAIDNGQGILYYTRERSLGVLFIKDKVILVSVEGHMDMSVIAGTMLSTTLI